MIWKNSQITFIVEVFFVVVKAYRKFTTWSDFFDEANVIFTTTFPSPNHVLSSFYYLRAFIDNHRRFVTDIVSFLVAIIERNRVLSRWDMFNFSRRV